MLSTENQRFAEDMLKKFVGSYIGLNLGFYGILQSGAPKYLVASTIELVDQKSRQIRALSEVLGFDPGNVVISRVDQVLEEIQKGNFRLEGLRQLRRGDEQALRRLKSELGIGILSFGQYDESYKSELVNGILQYPKEFENRAKQFFFDGRWCDFGSWQEASIPEADSSFSGSLSVEVPLVGGRNIEIATSAWKKRMFPRQDTFRSPGQTFQVSNAVFYYDINPSNRSNSRTITLLPNDDSLLTTGFPDEEIVFFALDTSVRKLVKRQAQALLRSEALVIIFSDLGISLVQFQKSPLIRTAFKIMEFVSGYNSSEQILGEEDLNFNYLIEQYKVDKHFPGTCKSTATLMAGFWEALGLPARIVSGSVEYKDRVGGPHMWAEIYIPSLRKYVPADPALGEIFTYPTENMRYNLGGTLCPQPGEVVKLKVEQME